MNGKKRVGAARQPVRRALCCALPIIVVGSLTAARSIEEGPTVIPHESQYPNSAGTLSLLNVSKPAGDVGAFFQSLGTNGRSCGTCHVPADAMSVSAAHIRQRFNDSDGADPIFRTNDGSTCNTNNDYSLLMSRGLFRIAIAVPSGADFYVQSVANPYGCGDTVTLSMYRRPLPGANLNFLNTVMWDGRESSPQTGTTPITPSNYPQSLAADLAHQALDATLGHAGGSQAPTAEQLQQIVAFETGLYTAQAVDQFAGPLNGERATGGPAHLVHQPFYIGANDPVGMNPTGAAFTPVIFNLFESWANLGHGSGDARGAARARIARGQALFNSKPIAISGVAGLNGATFPSGVTVPSSFAGTCGTCHDTPNVGNHSVSLPIDIGVADTANSLGVAYLPRITLCPNNGGSCVTTTDPGRALVTGKFADIGKFKGPTLRGLAARAPYFHNGSAQSLEDVVRFYDVRFGIGFTTEEIEDLVAFLNSL